MKTDNTIVSETIYIALFSLFLSVIMQCIFLVSGYWSSAVLLGNLLSASVSVINFYLMGCTVRKAVAQDEKEAKNTIKASQTMRTLFVFVFVAIGVLLPYFSTLATIIPLFFTRVAVMFRPLFNNK